jgi:CBS domain-containing protein
VELARHPEPLSCRPECSVAEAARILRSANAEAIAVMQDQKLEGIVTTSDVLGWAADGAPASRTAKDIMSAAPPAVAPQTLVSDCVLAMGRANSNVAALNADGTSHGGLLRLVSAADLQPAFGDNPLVLLREIAGASELEVLRLLHLRARAFLLGQLTEPSTIDWLASFADRINICLVKRLVELAGNANGNWCWCFSGAAGRCELLAAVEPEIALLCPDAAAVSRARPALDRLRADLVECGYLPYTMSEWTDATLCDTGTGWQERFEQWIRDPILSRMYQARPLFDLRPAFGDADLWRQLEQGAFFPKAFGERLLVGASSAHVFPRRRGGGKRRTLRGLRIEAARAGSYRGCGPGIWYRDRACFGLLHAGTAGAGTSANAGARKSFSRGRGNFESAPLSAGTHRFASR